MFNQGATVGKRTKVRYLKYLMVMDNIRVPTISPELASQLGTQEIGVENELGAATIG